jgi:hypothetical protein
MFLKFLFFIAKVIFKLFRFCLKSFGFAYKWFKRFIIGAFVVLIILWWRGRKK